MHDLVSGVTGNLLSRVVSSACEVLLTGWQGFLLSLCTPTEMCNKITEVNLTNNVYETFGFSVPVKVDGFSINDMHYIYIHRHVTDAVKVWLDI